MIAILDIETIAPSWPDHPRYEEDRFPPVPLHLPICISVGLANPEEPELESIKTRLIREGGEEREAIDALGRSLQSFSGLVTWNGRGFDLPVLMLRAMHHGLDSWRWALSKSARFRYEGGWHLDTMDQLRGFGAAYPMALNDVAEALGIGSKVVDSSTIDELVALGDWKTIQDHCEQDVRLTWKITHAATRLGLELPRGRR